MVITKELLLKLGVRHDVADKWVGPLSKAAADNDINTPRRLAGFLPCILHETGGLTTLVEDQEYSYKSLMEKFGGPRTLRDGTPTTRITAAEASAWCYVKDAAGRFVRHADGEAIFNRVYGGPWGLQNLGNTEPGDGYLTRGGGPIQTTGRGNYEIFLKKIGWTGSFEEGVNYVRTVEGGSQAAAYYWKSTGLNELCDQLRFYDARYRANGGTIGMEDFLERNALARQVLGDGDAPVPAPAAPKPIPARPGATPSPLKPKTTPGIDDDRAATEELNRRSLEEAKKSR